MTVQNLFPPQDVLEELTSTFRQAIFKILRIGIGFGLVALTGSLLWGRQQGIISRQGYIGHVLDLLNWN